VDLQIRCASGDHHRPRKRVLQQTLRRAVQACCKQSISQLQADTQLAMPRPKWPTKLLPNTSTVLLMIQLSTGKSILAPLMFCYNTSFHRSIKNTPYFLTYGQEPRLPNLPTPDLRRKFYGESSSARIIPNHDVCQGHGQKIQ
jgi:hypothetical protein